MLELKLRLVYVQLGLKPLLSVHVYRGGASRRLKQLSQAAGACQERWEAGIRENYFNRFSDAIQSETLIYKWKLVPFLEAFWQGLLKFLSVYILLAQPSHFYICTLDS